MVATMICMGYFVGIKIHHYWIGVRDWEQASDVQKLDHKRKIISKCIRTLPNLNFSKEDASAESVADVSCSNLSRNFGMH